MGNLPPNLLQHITEVMCRPEGTVQFAYTSEEDLFNPDVPGGIIFQIPSGGHYFLLERTDNAEMKFYHSSPGTGTRVATIDLKASIPSKTVLIYFTWSPQEIQLYIGPKVEGGKLLSAVGIPSQIDFRVGEDGSVLKVYNSNMQTMGLRFNIEGKQVIKPTAIDTWQETKKAIEILLTGESKEGFIFEIVKANLSIVMMVTGFEAYCKTRFNEIEKEGIQANHEKILEKLKNRKENFQDLDGYCKDIYKLCFGIKFHELVSASEFSSLKRIFSFRGRIIHASPLIAEINEFNVPKEKPLFSSNIVDETLAIFNKFIYNLHEKTLQLTS